MNKVMTLPDNLAEISISEIRKCYGYLFADPRWLVGLPQFATPASLMNP